MCDPYQPTNSFPADLSLFPRFAFLLLALGIFTSVGVLCVYWGMGASSFAGTSREVSLLKGTVGDRASPSPLGASCFLKHLSHTNFHYTVFRRFDNHDSHVFVSLKWRLVLLWLLPGHTAVHAIVPAAQLTSTADAVTSSVAQAGLDRLSFIIVIIISSLTIPSPASWTLLRSLR